MNLRWRLSHARGYLELGMVREAAAELDAIEPADADDAAVRALRVALLHELQDWPRLQQLARELVARQPDEAGWWVSLAFATRRCESLEGARAILLEAEQRHAAEPVIHFNLGCYAAQLGALDEARVRVLRAIALSEDFRAIARSDPDLAPLRAVDPEFPGRG
jgi:tetratricopeptide (TPR) repeat protein